MYRDTNNKYTFFLFIVSLIIVENGLSHLHTQLIKADKFN